MPWLETRPVVASKRSILILDRSHQLHSCAHAAPDFALEDACRIRHSRRIPVGAKNVRRRLLAAHPLRGAWSSLRFLNRADSCKGS